MGGAMRAEQRQAVADWLRAYAQRTGNLRPRIPVLYERLRSHRNDIDVSFWQFARFLRYLRTIGFKLRGPIDVSLFE